MLIINSFLFQAKDENVSAMWENGHYYRGRVLEICNEGNQKTIIA